VCFEFSAPIPRETKNASRDHPFRSTSNTGKNVIVHVSHEVEVCEADMLEAWKYVLKFVVADIRLWPFPSDSSKSNLDILLGALINEPRPLGRPAKIVPE
jgi:hypothetical protein